MHIHAKGRLVAVVALSMFLVTQIGQADDRQSGENAASPDPSTIPQAPTSPKLIEKARQAVDLLLAETLNDPMSAIQYRVSQPMPCVKLSTAEQEKGLLCICYEVNTRDKSGGYQGRRLEFVSLRPENDGTFVAGKAWGMGVRYDYREQCAGDLQKRKSKRIHELVD